MIIKNEFYNFIWITSFKSNGFFVLIYDFIYKQSVSHQTNWLTHSSIATSVLRNPTAKTCKHIIFEKMFHR